MPQLKSWCAQLIKQVVQHRVALLAIPAGKPRGVTFIVEQRLAAAYRMGADHRVVGRQVVHGSELRIVALIAGMTGEPVGASM